MRQDLADPRAGEVLPSRAAYAHLMGMPPTESIDDLLTETFSPTPGDIVGLMSRLHRTTLLGVPMSMPWTGRLPMSAQPLSSAPVPGARHRARGWPADHSVLAVHPTAVSIGAGAEHVVAAFDDLAGVLAYPDGARTFVRRDGWRVHLEPTLWARGPSAVESVDAAVHPGLLLPMPARDRDDVPRPPTAGQVTMALFRRWWKVGFTILAGLLCLGLFAALAWNGYLPSYLFTPFVTGAIIVAIISLRRQRSG